MPAEASGMEKPLRRNRRPYPGLLQTITPLMLKNLLRLGAAAVLG